MHPEDIRSLTQNAFNETKSPLTRDIFLNNLGVTLSTISSVIGAAEFCAGSDIKTQLFTLGVFALSFGTVAKTWDAQKIHMEISDALKTRKDYEQFVTTYVTDTMLPRFIHDFSLDDPDIGITIYGTSEQILHKLIAAKILDYAAAYQEDDFSGKDLKEPEKTVQEVLECSEMPRLNRELAEKLRVESTALYDTLSPTQKLQERNWDLEEIQDAAEQIGDILGDQIEYEIEHAFFIHEDNQTPSLAEKIILGRRNKLRRRRQMQELAEEKVKPDLLERQSTLAYRIHKIGNDHRAKHRS